MVNTGRVEAVSGKEDAGLAARRALVEFRITSVMKRDWIKDWRRAHGHEWVCIS